MILNLINKKPHEKVPIYLVRDPLDSNDIEMLYGEIRYFDFEEKGYKFDKYGKQRKDT